MSKFRWLIAIIVTFIVAVILYNKVLHPPYTGADKNAPKSKVLRVNGVIVQPQALDNNVLSSGTLVASESVDLHAQSSGTITALNLNEGTYVAGGTLLVKLFDDDLQAELKKLEAQKEAAERTEQRMKELLAVNGVGQQDYDNASTSLKGILADIENIKAQIEKTEIRAPFDGMIGLRNVSLGAYLTPSTSVASLQKINPLKMDFNVPEKYAPDIHKGDLVNFTVGGFTNTFQARVYAIEPHIDEDTRALKVRALVQNGDARLLPGAFADIQVVLQRIENALMIPSQCVISDIRNKSVVVAKNGIADFRIVSTGVRSESSVQIANGIQAGDTVITSSLLFLKPKMAVSVSVTN